MGGVILGPPLGRLSQRPRTLALLACTFACCAVAYACFLPESLQRGRARGQKARRAVMNTTTMKGLMRSKTFVLVSVIAGLSSMASEGTQDIGAQFLMMTAKFDINDQGNLITSVGVTGMIAQFVLLPLLLRHWPRKRVNLIVLLVNGGLVIVNIAICFATRGASKWVAPLLVSLSYLSLISFTVCSGILSNATDEAHQGLVTGVISGVRAQAYGIGPLIYSWIFKAFTETDTNLPFLPGAPYLFTALMMLVTALLAFWLDPDTKIV